MGYKLEGMQRKGIRSKATGKIHDVNMYGLLKKDWKKVRIELIRKQAMNIIRKTKELNLPPNKYIVIGSGLLDILGIRSACVNAQEPFLRIQ